MTPAEPKPRPETTDDGHFVVISGRRWRATDPAIPEDVAAVLRRALMAARRAVGAALRAGEDPAPARARVQAAKVALGERGVPWWEQTLEQRRRRWEQGLRAADQPPGRSAAPRP
ncbi:hypothetical protein GCM10020358_44820 [Amorphoplanes nipponensis]|uniref:Biopolymer transporter Tol n=1 Tax=Actinoplanes nipponensis TaxID=135950 RepID=A0A919MQH1_9ACTN|nr:hypothetical protein [Actinoplanes nipponensis]GIE53646.1 hypothetical protein Ani05nite_71800 [Actinoplanes nipponensis]